MSLEKQNQSSWKSRIYLQGTLGGLVIGFLAAHFYARAVEESKDDDEDPEGIQAADSIKLILSILTLIRQITELGNKK